MLRADVPLPQRLHKLFVRIRRQHSRNPALLPLLLVGSFIAISLFLFFVFSGPPVPPRPSTSPSPPLTPSVQSTPPSDDDGPPIVAGVRPGNPRSPPPATPSMPLWSQALTHLRGELERKVEVQDFEGAILLRDMMKLIGEDREGGLNREGEVREYTQQLKERVTEGGRKGKRAEEEQRGHGGRVAELEEKVVALQREIAELSQPNAVNPPPPPSQRHKAVGGVLPLRPGKMEKRVGGAEEEEGGGEEEEGGDEEIGGWATIKAKRFSTPEPPPPEEKERRGRKPRRPGRRVDAPEPPTMEGEMKTET